MRRLNRFIGAASAGALAVVGLAFGASPTSAMHNSQAPCMVVTHNTTLTGDVGPCPGHGIVIAADNVTLDLNGFTVQGDQTPMEQAGVFFDNVSGSTVKNGTVTGFDAGVYIEGGGGNTVTGITATRNQNDMMEPVDPFTIIPPGHTGPLTPQMQHDINLVTCKMGDGIATFDSDDNVIEKNIVTENGPLSGISLAGDSDGNLVSENEVHENDMTNFGVVTGAGNPVWVLGSRHVPAGTAGATQPTSMCGGTQIGTPGMPRGRAVANVGISIVGPGANNNVVDKNTVTKSGIAGIAIHSHIEFPAAPNVPVQQPNTNNVVSENSVSLTGTDTHQIDPYADGISSLSSGPIGNVTMPPFNNTYERNVVFNNMRHGISLNALTTGNIVDKNQVYGNRGSGVWVAGPTQGAHDNFLISNRGSGNGEFDGTDLNPGCDNNLWVANEFGTVNQPCVASGQPPTPNQVITGDRLGPVTVGAGESLLITDARVVGPVTVNPGGALTVINSQISRGITADAPSSFTLCGTRVSGPSPGVALSVTNAPVPLRIGDPAMGCAGNSFAGQVNLIGNLALTFGSNVVSHNTTVNSNGPGSTVIKDNRVFGTLGCTGNSPPPTNAGQLNTAGAKTGQCAGL